MNAPNAPYAVLRVHAKKAKTMAAISAASEHHMQTEPSSNHDASAHPPLVLHLVAGKTPFQAARHLLHGVEKRNRDTVLCREVVLSASPSYFRPGREEQAGVFDPDRLKAWTVAALQWAKRQWPDQLASCVLHTSEVSPHLHLLLIPRVRKGTGWHLNSKALFDRERLRELQTSYAEALAPLNIRRGEPGSQAKHTDVKQFYGAVQAAQAVPVRPQLPSPPKAPMPPAALTGRLWATVLHAIGRDAPHDAAMRAHRQELARWRETVRKMKEDDARAWSDLAAAAAIAPIRKRAAKPVDVPADYAPPRPELRTRPRPR